jgi:hypothetical protein
MIMKRFKMRGTIFSLMSLSILLLTSIGFAQKTESSLTFSSQEVKNLIESAGGLKEYPNASAIIITNNIDGKYVESGACRFIEHALIKILTDKGKEGYSSLKIGYNPLYNKVEFLHVRIIKKDGTIIDAPLTDVKDVPAAGGTIFWGDREKVLTLSGLEVGDAVEYRTEKLGVKIALLNEEEEEFEKFVPPMKDQFYHTVLFQGTNPILEKKFTLSGPKNKPIRYKVYNGQLAYDSHSEGEHLFYSWEAKNMSQIIREPMMVPIDEVATKLIVTTVPSWRYMSKWMYEISEPSFETDKAIKEKVAELTEDCTTDQEKIKALFHFVADEIRYVGLSMGEGEGYTPHPATRTFKERGGVCKDKAGLFVAMLREAGFPAYIVMINIGHRVEDLPANQFNHAIVAIRQPDGSFEYLCPTWGEHSRELFSNYEQLQSTIIATEEGEDLGMTPPRPSEDNLMEIEAKSKVESDGKLTSELKLSANGATEQNLREMIKYSPKAKIRERFVEIVHSISPEAKLIDYSYSDVDNLSEPLTITISYEIENYGFKAGDNLLFKIPAAVSVEQCQSVFRATTLDERKYDLRLGNTGGLVYEERISFPKSYKVRALPDEVEVNYPIGSFKTQYQSRGNGILCAGELLYSKSIVVVEDYPKLKEVANQANKSKRYWVVLQKTG